jgi:uncharacterized protein YegP (UPF0339 family)
MTDPTQPDDRQKQAYVDRMAAHIIESVQAFDPGADHEVILAAIRAAKFVLIPRPVWFTPQVDVAQTEEPEPVGLQHIYTPYQDAAGEWRWRATSAFNGQVVSASGESFGDKTKAYRAAHRIVSMYKDGLAEVRDAVPLP